MDINDQGRAAMHGGAEALGDAAAQVRRGAGRMAESASEAAGHAARCARNAGREVSSFVQRRPVETALLSAAAACLITGLAFWYTRPD